MNLILRTVVTGSAGWAVLASVVVQAASVRLELPVPNGGLASTVLVPAGAGEPERFAGGMGVLTSTEGGVVTSRSGGDVVLWDSRTGKISKRFGAHRASVDGLGASRTGHALASFSSADGTAQVWDVASGELRRTWKAEDGALATSGLGRSPLVSFAPDGGQVAASGAVSRIVGSQQVWISSRLQVWDVSTGAEAWALSDAGVGAMGHSPEGGALVAYTRRVDWVADGDTATGITGWVATGNDVQLITTVVRGNGYHLLRSAGVDSTWIPVARATAAAETLVLTDTNALVGVPQPRFYRVARD